MGSVDADCDPKQELNDSGCVQDDNTTHGYDQVNLLDLSDDVLLYILRRCGASELKALGFSCPRLGRLVRERSLWKQVDARSQPCSQARLKWLVENGVHQDTTSFKISGFARQTEGCLGLVNITRKEAAEEKRQLNQNKDGADDNAYMADQIHEIPIPVHLERHHARFFISAQRSTHLPRFRGFPPWNDEADMGRDGPDICHGPQFTLTQSLLALLAENCPNLTTLAFEYLNINCSKTNVTHFPKTLRKLSLRGTKCFNMSIDKSFLFKIQESLPLLESLDVSECEWMDPSTLLPLSKMPKLEELIMKDCLKMAEFVAYASLTARYGFRTLKALDLRGSPVGDSEVSALGWLPRLESLWLAADRGRRTLRHHAHYVDDDLIPHEDLYDWEKEEPDYFKSRTDPETIVPDPVERVRVREVAYEAPNSPNNVRAECEPDYCIKRKSDDGSGDSDEANNDYRIKRQRVGNDANDENEDGDNSQESTDGNDSELDRILIANDMRQFLLPTASCSKTLDKPKESDDEEEDDDNDNDDDDGNANQNDAVKETEKNDKDEKNEDSSEDQNSDETKFEKKFNADKAVQTEISKIGDAKADFKITERVEESANEANDENPNDDDESENEDYADLKIVEHEFAASADDIIAKIEITETVQVRGYDDEDDSSDDEGSNENDQENVEKKNDDVMENASNDEDRDENPNNKDEGDEGNPDITMEELDCIVDCIKIDQLIDVTELRCGRKNEVIVIASTTRPKPGNSSRCTDKPVEKEDEDSDKPNQEPNDANEANDNQKPVKDDSESKNLKRPNVMINEGASTSKAPDRSDEPKEKYVCFRKNQDPVYVNCEPEPEQNENRNPNENQDQRREPLPPIQYQIEPRHHVLYVSVGPQLNTYRFPRDAVELDRHLNLNFRHTHVDSTSLVTDFAIRRFGRADGEDVNIIHIGPNGPMVVGNETGSRPDRSNLRFLSVTGYRNITDRSLVHLATAAPNLVQIDFSETNVTESGAENFRSMRPDCELTFSKFKKE